MVRRTFEIAESHVEIIETLAKKFRLDKSEVVQLALMMGLPEVEGRLVGIGRAVDVIGERLREEKKRSIKAPSAERRKK